MIQLPAGATVAIPGQARERGLGWRPGGIPGIHTRHSPGWGRWPGGTPKVAAELGPSARASGGMAGVGLRITVLVVLQQPASNVRLRSEERRVGKECRSRW